jgi:hypothetical protein
MSNKHGSVSGNMWPMNLNMLVYYIKTNSIWSKPSVLFIHENVFTSPAEGCHILILNQFRLAVFCHDGCGHSSEIFAFSYVLFFIVQSHTENILYIHIGTEFFNY